MYWLLSGNPLTFLPWIFTAGMVWIGGWLLATHAFRLQAGERLAAGLGIGLVVYLWFANLFGHWLGPGLAFFVAALAVLLCGAAFAWRGPRPVVHLSDLQSWPLLTVVLILVIWFTLVGKGLTIFDEPKNLTLVSRMAAGDIPPHFYLNSDFYFRYHYGFQLLGSVLMRLGGMFPWSAFDLAKGLVWGLAVGLAYLLGKRYTAHPAGGILAGLVMAFASGTRYLLLFLPPAFLGKADQSVTLLGTSELMDATFSQSLVRGWTIDGGPPSPFLFAYLNGIFPPLTMAHAGSYTLSFVILALVLLLGGRARRPASFGVLAVLLAYWGVVWESSYGLFAVGAAAVLGFILIKQRWSAPQEIRLAFLAVMLSGPLVILQGGTITEIARQLVFRAADAGVGVEGTVQAGGFSLRWPPALLSAHLGGLNLFSPYELVIAFFELGPILLLTPWITLWAWRRMKAGEWVFGALIASAWIGFLAPLFLVYQAERDISRFTGHSMLVWTLFLVLIVLENMQPAWNRLRQAGAVTLGLMVFGGVVITGIELTAVYAPYELGYKLGGLDARVARQTWDRLPQGSLVFDPALWRASALTGLPTRVAVSGTDLLPAWERLRSQPAVVDMLANDYQYVYIDELWWEGLPQAAQAELTAACVVTLAEAYDREGERFRKLIDISGCR